MEKQVALIVSDDVTELNRRLSTGFRVYNNFTMNNGTIMFILVQYNNRVRETGLEGISPAVANELTYTGTI
jgi:hypothetical protein